MDETELSPFQTDPIDRPPLMPVRRLHNYVYCPRLFYYQWIENLFVENADTVAGHHIHRNVDKPSGMPVQEDKIELPAGSKMRSLKLESESLGVIGVVDLIEEQNGVCRIVDYKKGSAWRNEQGERVAKEADAIQVLAHVLLLREHGLHVTEASVYYAEEKRHAPVPLTNENLTTCKNTIDKAHKTALSGQCPPPLNNDPRCLYCSMYPICLPNESNYWNDPHAVLPTEITTPPRPDNDEAEVLVVQKPGAVVGVRGNRFTVSFKSETMHKMPVEQVRAIYIYGAVQLTAAAAQYCLANYVDVSFFAPSGRFLGLLRGLPASGIDARMGQYRAFQNTEIRLLLAREFIRAKIHNQRVMIMRNGEPERSVLNELERLRDRCIDTTTIEELMGVEGRAASLYFNAFSGMLRNDLGFSFEKRNRRPPRDPVNAMLSLAYSVLTKELTGICHAVGLDPFVGFLHAPRYGRPALALDLMEEFRPLIADSVVISLLNRLELKKSDFVFSSNGVYLDESGRRSFWEAYSRRMDTEIKHPVFNYRMAYRRMMEVQCRQIWRFLRGEANTYTGFTTR